MATVSVRLLNEKDFVRAGEFVSEIANEGSSRKILIAPMGNWLPSYQDIAIRTRQFHKSELFLGYFKGNELCALVSFIRKTYPITMFYIGLFIMQEESIGLDLLAQATEMFKQKGVKYFKIALENTEPNKQKLSVLKELNFEYEACLKAEGTNCTDIIVYTKNIGGDTPCY